MFDSRKVDFSAGEKVFERCLSRKLFWPSPKPEDTMAIPLAQGALTFFAREYDKLQTLFLSRVVQPGTVLIGHDWLPGEPVGWVLNTSRWGVLVLLGHVQKSDGNRGTLEISIGDKCFEQRYVHDSIGDKCFEQWYVHDLDKMADDAHGVLLQEGAWCGRSDSTALRD